MASVNPSFNISPDLLRTLIAVNNAEQAKKHDKEDPKAALAQLAKTLEEVLASVTPSAGKADPKDNPSSPPSNAQMQKDIGELMAILGQLEGEIARYGERNAEANAGIGRALMTEMTAQVAKANDEVQNIIQNQESADFWSTFTKVAEIVVGAIIAAIAIACGQPEIAVIVIVFTALAVSGAMDKITSKLADSISASLVKDGMPKEEADKVAKVIADIIVIAASIIITLVTCGAGAAGTAEVAADAGLSAAEEGAEEAVEMAAVDGEGAAAQAAESTESMTQKLENILSKAADWIKENNPFNKLPKNVNLSIVAGAQALGSTNFGRDVMAASLMHMKDKKTKEELEIIFGTIINLLASLAGAGAGASVCMGSSTSSVLNNTSTWIRALMGAQLVGQAGQFAGQVGSGVTYSQQASLIAEQGRTQAVLSEVQALVSMNSQQSSADAKALNAKMKTWASEIASLSHTLNLAGEAVAHELQA